MPAGTVDGNGSSHPRCAARADVQGARGGAEATTKKILVIGLGNPLVSDDSVGLRIANRLQARLEGCRRVDITEDYWGGLRLMERMIGYDAAIVVDAICTGAAPGTIHRLGVNTVATQKSASAHDVNLPTALEFGRQAGAPLPPDEDIRLLGVEAEDVINFSDQCTPAVAAAIEPACAEVVRLLETMLGEQPK